MLNTLNWFRTSDRAEVFTPAKQSSFSSLIVPKICINENHLTKKPPYVSESKIGSKLL